MADWPTIASLATAGGTLVGVIYLAAAVRNAGQGVAVLHAWYCFAGWRTGAENRPTPEEDFRRLTRDIYVAPGDIGFCQGAIRDRTTRTGQHCSPQWRATSNSRST